MRRYDQWHRTVTVGDRDLALQFLPEGRKWLGYVHEQLGMTGNDQGIIRRTTPAGVQFTARIVAGQPKLTIDVRNVAPEALEEVEYLYVSASDGLRIYDMGTKVLAKRITGLGSYRLQAIDRPGKLAWLTLNSALQAANVVRVDIPALAAFGHTYAVKSVATPDTDPPVDGIAIGGDDAALAPDADRLLVHFSGSAVGGAQKEGVGGVLLVDATTLDPVRAPIRMSFLPAPMTWAPDGTRFYLGCSQPDDVGDLPATTRLLDLTTSTSDHLAVFDRDGVLLATRQLASWGFTPDSGWSRLIKGVVASATRVYVTVDAGVDIAAPHLVVLDATDPVLPVVDTLDLSDIAATAPPNLCLTRGGKALLLSYTDRVAEVAIANDELAITYSSVHAQFATWAPNRSAAYEQLQLGPLSRFGGPPDERRFFFNYDTDVTVVRGYRTLALREGAPRPVYEFDLATDGISFQPTYRIASVGARPKGKAP